MPDIVAGRHDVSQRDLIPPLRPLHQLPVQSESSCLQGRKHRHSSSQSQAAPGRADCPLAALCRSASGSAASHVRPLLRPAEVVGQAHQTADLGAMQVPRGGLAAAQTAQAGHAAAAGRSPRSGGGGPPLALLPPLPRPARRLHLNPPAQQQPAMEQQGSFEQVVQAFSSQVAELREATLLRVDGEGQGRQAQPARPPPCTLAAARRQPAAVA